MYALFYMLLQQKHFPILDQRSILYTNGFVQVLFVSEVEYFCKLNIESIWALMILKKYIFPCLTCSHSLNCEGCCYKCGEGNGMFLLLAKEQQKDCCEKANDYFCKIMFLVQCVK